MMKGFWDEMLNFEPQPICKCTTACQCGVIKSLMDYENQEQIVLFLNGINDTYSPTREQKFTL